jgi:TonB family protein
MPSVIQVFVLRDGALEGTELVSSDHFVVGSDGLADVVLEDPSVSPRHLGVFVHEGRLAVSDLGSSTGTVIGGARIEGSRYVSSREDVVVGPFTLKLKLMSSAAPEQRAPSGVPAPAAAPPLPQPLTLHGSTPSPSGAPSETIVSAGQQNPGSTALSAQTFDHASATLQHTITDEVRPAAIIGSDETTDVDSLQAPRSPSRPRERTPSPSEPVGGSPAVTDDEHDLEDADDDAHSDDVPWSLVARLSSTLDQGPTAPAVVEVVHCRGERVLDHRLVRRGERFVFGSEWSADALAERGLEAPIPVVQLRGEDRAELMPHPLVTSRVGSMTSTASTIARGEQATLSVGDDRLIVRFVAVPAFVWSPEQRQELHAARRLNAIAGFCAAVLLSSLGAMSWLYGFRSKDVDVIELGDDGFADIVIKDLEFKEPPPKKEPERPAPIQTPEPAAPPPETAATPAPEPASKEPAKPTPSSTTPSEAPKATGLAAALSSIPKVNDSASSQNLNAALSNIKGVRVPGAQGDFKTSALTGKGPSAGVQIGGAAGGVATSGINSLIRKDGAAGSLGGKGDRAVAGKVTTQPRLSSVKGAGELSKDEIQRVINAHVGEIQYCYEKQLRGNSGLAGRVVLEWTVTPAGAVSVVKVSTSSLSSSDATNCMMDRVKKWKFPKPRGNGGVTVVYPFVFNTI